MLYLHSLGHFHPETVIDNSFLCSLDIGVDPARIDERVGINERHTTLSLQYNVLNDFTPIAIGNGSKGHRACGAAGRYRNA